MLKIHNLKLLQPMKLFGRFRQTIVPPPLAAKLQQSPDFAPQTVIRDWGNGDAFTIGDALTGVIVFGTTGSGKTSGPGKHLAYGCLAKGFGALVLTAKPDECAQWAKYATETGRLDDVRIIDASGKYQFNFMNHEAPRPGAGAGFTTNIVRMLVVIAMAIAGDSSTEGGGNGGSNKFWQDSLEHMLTNLVDLLVLARVEVSLSLMRSILNSAPMTVEQATSQEWLDTSDCASALRGAEKMTIDGDPEAFADYEECKTYWLKEFPGLSEKTRSIIVLTFSMLVRPLVTRPLRKLFSGGTTITPEDAFDGRIIIVNLPVQEFSVAGRIANLIWKYSMQVAIMRRTQPKEPGQYLRPVISFFPTNFRTLLPAETRNFSQAVARSAGGVSIYLTQNREGLRRVLKSDDAVDSLLANLFSAWTLVRQYGFHE